MDCWNWWRCQAWRRWRRCGQHEYTVIQQTDNEYDNNIQIPFGGRSWVWPKSSYVGVQNVNIFFTNPDGLKIDTMNVEIQDMAARFTFVVESPISSSVVMLLRTRSSSMPPSPYHCPRIVQEIGSGSYIGKLLQDVRGSSLTINASVDIVMRSKRCHGFELRVPRL